MTKEIASSLGSKLTFSTYGANPIAMAAGREALKVVDDEKMQQNCLEKVKKEKQLVKGSKSKNN